MLNKKLDVYQVQNNFQGGVWVVVVVGGGIYKSVISRWAFKYKTT
jgi:hypothetical protein